MKFRTPILMLALLSLTLAVAGTASAHKTAYSSDGKIKIVWGFLNEPAVTYTKTGLDLILSDNVTGAPIDGVTANTLTVEMHKGDNEMAFKDFGPQFGTHGRYTGVITPTEPGIYVLHLTGTINGSDMGGAAGMEIEGAHAIESIDDTYFPKVNSTAADVAALKTQIASMQTAIDALNAKVKAQAETPVSTTPQSTAAPAKGIPAPALGIVALGVVAVALIVRRRSG